MATIGVLKLSRFFLRQNDKFARSLALNFSVVYVKDNFMLNQRENILFTKQKTRQILKSVGFFIIYFLNFIVSGQAAFLAFPIRK